MKLSVCIPVYDVAPYVGQCARSLFAQTYEDMEFVFVDDGSPDESIAIVERVLKDFPNRADRVKILRHERNRGLVAARKTAIRAATGGRFFYVNHAEAELANLTLFRGAAGCSAGGVWIDGRGGTVSPCAYSGLYQTWMATATDFFGHPRTTPGKKASIGFCQAPNKGMMMLFR